MITEKSNLSYSDAGVDIDAGNALVEAIKPAAASTRRLGSDTGLGGFGGFDAFYQFVSGVDIDT